MDEQLNSLGIESSTLERISKVCSTVVRDLGLSLTNCTVLTECATGAYCSTALLAAMAGAKVYAYGKDTRFGTRIQAREQTEFAAKLLGVEGQIEYIDSLNTAILAQSDVVTNSGHLRPLDAQKISAMRPGAVIPLMYEAWEFRETDIDLQACRQLGIRVVGTNEHHSNLMIFDYLGMLAIRGLFELGIPVKFCRILLLSDNLFAEPIFNALHSIGGTVYVTSESPIAGNPKVQLADRSGEMFDAVVLAMTPKDGDCVGEFGQAPFSLNDLGGAKAFIQIWGDVLRDSLTGVRFYPSKAPKHGHMGVLLNDIGPDPVVRLQAGGLRAAMEVFEKSSSTLSDRYSQEMVV
jgi:hypothetical protein